MKTTIAVGVEYKYYDDSELETFADLVIAGNLNLDVLYDEACNNATVGIPLKHPILQAVSADPMSAVMSIDALVKHKRKMHLDNSKKLGPAFKEYFEGHLDETLANNKFVSLVKIQTWEIVPVYVKLDGSLHTEW